MLFVFNLVTNLGGKDYIYFQVYPYLCFYYYASTPDVYKFEILIFGTWLYFENYFLTVAAGFDMCSLIFLYMMWSVRWTNWSDTHTHKPWHAQGENRNIDILLYRKILNHILSFINCFDEVANIVLTPALSGCYLSHAILEFIPDKWKNRY